MSDLRRPTQRRLHAPTLAAALVLLVAVPAVGAGSATVPPPRPGAAGLAGPGARDGIGAVPIPSVAPPGAGALARLLPGAYGARGPTLSLAQLAGLAGVGGATPARLLGPAARSAGVPGARAPGTSRDGPPARGPPAWPAPVDRPLGATEGSFSGYVRDASSGKGLDDASILESTPTACPNCTATNSGANGSFLIDCAAPGGLGDDYTLTVYPASPWWTSNVTYAVCVAGTDTNVGSIDLVRMGAATGLVLSAATDAPVPNVTVFSQPREGASTGGSGTTNASGGFLIPVPPQPSIVSFDPPSLFEATFNYTNATPGTGARPPWNDPVRMGTVYLSALVVVRAELRNALTGAPLGNGTDGAIQACDAATGTCQLAGATAPSGTVEALASPGPNYFIVDATGFAQATVPSRTVPPEPPGTVDPLGSIYLTPFGAFDLFVNLSAPAGGSFPWSAKSTTAGGYSVSVCSLDGYPFLIPPASLPGNFSVATCVADAVAGGRATTIVAPPFRDAIGVEPPGGPPSLPLIATSITVNLTAGRALGALVWANVSFGDYVEGTVTVPGGGAPSGCFLVSAASTDGTVLGGLGAWSSCLDDDDTAWAPCDSLGNLTAGAFCVPVPPGDSRLTVSATGYASNWTWIHVPEYCCRVAKGAPGYPTSVLLASGGNVTDSRIDLRGATGNVTGWVREGVGPGALVPPQFAVDVCPALGSPGGVTSGCVPGVRGAGGSFVVDGVPSGEDVVNVSVAGYAPDSDWVNVTPGLNASAGTIPLFPDGTISGRVLSASGGPVPFAEVEYCPLADPAPCYALSGDALGVGYTSSSGVFNGTVPGGWAPWATYLVGAFDAGYSSDWEIANASSGGFTRLAPLVLVPLSAVDAGRPARPLAPATAPAGVWVTGQLVDRATGMGVDVSGAALLDACPVLGGLCTPFPDGPNTEGYFNGSVTPGAYYLNITAAGYAPTRAYLNATGRSTVALGAVPLTADDWVAGRAILEPWPSISYGAGGNASRGVAPVAVAQGCDAAGLDCQLPVPIAPNGTFNVSVPAAGAAEIAIEPPSGFVGNSTPTRLTGAYTTLSGNASDLGLPIFGTVAGRVLDADSRNVSGTSGPPLGLMLASVQVLTGGTTPGGDDVPTDAYGDWVAFVPGDNGPGNTSVVATEYPGYDGASFTVARAVTPGVAGPLDLNLTLYRYGWIDLHLESAGTGLPLYGALVAVDGTDPGLGTPATTYSYSNAAGRVNVTAAPGAFDNVTISLAQYNTTVLRAGWVLTDRTTYLANGSSSNATTVRIEPWGIVRSVRLNFSSNGSSLPALPSPDVVDPRVGDALPYASVATIAGGPAVNLGSGSATNWAGQFYTDAPPGGKDSLLVAAPGFVTNGSFVTVPAGTVDRVPTVNLTGDALLTGTVVSRLNGTPVPYANVTVCGPAGPYQPACTLFETNQSGVFWALGYPGDDTLWINGTGFVPLAVSVESCSECWVPIGNASVAPDGAVDGSVRGLPYGDLLDDANVSLCPQGLYLGVPCGVDGSTDADGAFYVPVLPGGYVLIAEAPFYNDTTFWFNISSGEIVDVGTLFLDAFGNASGGVLNGSSDLPIANASVLACPDWPGGNCAAPARTDALGRYTFDAAPGPYNLSAYADGYAIGYGSATVVTAGVAEVPSIYLFPIGDNTPVELSGRVVEAGDPSVGIAGAIVGAVRGGTVDFSTVSAGNGSFALDVAFGSYTLVTHKTPYAPAAMSILADRSTSDLEIVLGAQLYAVSGTAADGLTGQPLPGVALEGPVPSDGATSGLPVLATTNASGGFLAQLPNGSYELWAVPPAGGAVAYPDEPVEFTVAGGAVPLALSFAPGRNELSVTLLDAASGLPIAGATVLVAGAVEPGYGVRQSFSAGPTGTIAVPLYDAAYVVLASATGYATQQVTVRLNGSDVNLTLRLAAIGGSATTPGAFGIPPLELAGLVGVAGLAVAALLLLRRRRLRAPEPGASGPDPGEGIAEPERP